MGTLLLNQRYDLFTLKVQKSTQNGNVSIVIQGNSFPGSTITFNRVVEQFDSQKQSRIYKSVQGSTLLKLNITKSYFPVVGTKSTANGYLDVNQNEAFLICSPNWNYDF